METLLVRLRAFDPRRGGVLRRYTYRGIKFEPERGWYRVTKEVAEYLRTIHQTPRDPNAPLAFDVCTDDEARAMEAAEKKEEAGRQNATDDLKLSPARPESRTLTTGDLRVGGASPRAERTTTPEPTPSALPAVGATTAPGTVTPPGDAPEGGGAARGRRDRGG